MKVNEPSIAWLSINHSWQVMPATTVYILPVQAHQWLPLEAISLHPNEWEMVQRYIWPAQRLQKANAYWQVKKILAMATNSLAENVQLQWHSGRLVTTANWHISVSYSSQIFVVAICKKPVGVDVEFLQYPTSFQDVAQHICSPLELQRIEQATNKADEFLRIFTRKEAYLKCVGIGLIDQLSLLNVLPDQTQYGEFPEKNLLTTLLNGYCISVAY